MARCGCRIDLLDEGVRKTKCNGGKLLLVEDRGAEVELDPRRLVGRFVDEEVSVVALRERADVAA